jgi:LysR family transcriptional regulator, glycine cleavage system transcriptional activator
MREKKSPLEKASLPPLNAIRAFEAAARRGSFADAALDLNVTHWAVGKQIRLLENWFGLPLFERRARGVALTDDGAELLADVTAAFSRLMSASHRLGQTRSQRRISGVVRINVPTSFASGWLIPRLGDFQANFPNIEVKLSTTSRKLRYVGDAYDIGIRLRREPGAHFKFRPLLKDIQLPACSPDILRTRPLTVVSDLRVHTLLHSSTARAAWPTWLALAGGPNVTPAHQFEFDHVHLQLQAAVDGLGVAMASLPLIERELATGRLVCPLARPEWQAGEYLVVSGNDAESVATRNFRTWIVAEARRSAYVRN